MPKIEQRISGEKIPGKKEELESVLSLTDGQKHDILISLLSTYHSNISSWYTRAYQAVALGIGIQFSVIGYFISSPDTITYPAIAIAFTGVVLFSYALYRYLSSAIQSHQGNRLAISKCEAALRLYDHNEYFREKSFFTFSEDMMTSSSLNRIKRLHIITTIISLSSLIAGLLYYEIML